MLMTLSSDSLSPKGCGFTGFMSMSTMSVMSSDRPLPGKVPAVDLMAPLEAIVSRIEMRLLRDTSSVLDYNFPITAVGHVYQFLSECKMTVSIATRLTVVVKMLVSMVNRTMLTRAWLLKRPSLFLSLIR